MRAVVQKVKQAEVKVDGETVGKIDAGILLFLAVGRGDTEDDARSLAEKVSNLRIFPDDKGKMSLSVLDVKGEILVVSEFTLYGDCRKGRRPSFDGAALPDLAESLYVVFIDALKNRGIRVESGRFQALMNVSLINCGPVTLLLDSGKAF